MSRMMIALAAGTIVALSAGATDLQSAAEAVANCRSVPDADERQACFETTSAALDALLNPEPGVPAIAEAPAATVQPADTAPFWARAPAPEVVEARKAKARKIKKPKTPKEFDVTIIRVVKRLDKLTFYTDDGQVWVQTQNDPVKLPDEAPMVAKIKKRITGNPVIQFPNRSHSYKVRRVQ